MFSPEITARLMQPQSRGLSRMCWHEHQPLIFDSGMLTFRNGRPGDPARWPRENKESLWCPWRCSLWICHARGRGRCDKLRPSSGRPAGQWRHARRSQRCQQRVACPAGGASSLWRHFQQRLPGVWLREVPRTWILRVFERLSEATGHRKLRW